MLRPLSLCLTLAAGGAAAAELEPVEQADPLGVLVGDGSAGHLDWLPGARDLDDADGPQAIVNGTTAPTFTTVVALGLVRNSTFYGTFCSGTVVHPRWVLTAAHCLTEAERQRARGMAVYAFFDADLTGSQLTTYRSTGTIHIHPGYADNNPDLRDDIGLIQLGATSPVPTQGVLLDDPDTYRGEQLTFVGYGVTCTGCEDSGIRLKTQMTFRGCWAPDYFYQGYPCDPAYAANYEPQVLYSEASGTNVCSGDSGGAVFRRMSSNAHLLVGVNSFTSGNCESGRTGSARVEWFQTWIEQRMGASLQSVTTPSEDTGGADTGGADTGAGEPDTALGDAERPPDGAYAEPLFGACHVAPGAPAWLLGLVGLLAARRRTRA